MKTEIAVTHVDRDVSGEKVEPEQQTVLERGNLPVAVRMGVINPEGGPPVETSAPLTHGIQTGFSRQRTAHEVAEGIRRSCQNCRHFAALELGDRNLGGRTEIAQTLIAMGHPIPMAESMAASMGKCRHIGGLAHPHATCAAFREVRFGNIARALRDKYDEIMQGAAGRKAWWR